MTFVRGALAELLKRIKFPNVTYLVSCEKERRGIQEGVSKEQYGRLGPDASLSAGFRLFFGHCIVRSERTVFARDVFTGIPSFEVPRRHLRI